MIIYKELLQSICNVWRISRRVGLAVSLAWLIFAGTMAAQEPDREAGRRGEAGLRGTVLAADSGEPLSGARVSIAELGLSALADESGGFAFEGIPAGPYTVRVERTGFAPHEETVAVGEGEDRWLELALSAEPIPVPGVTVLVDRFRMLGPAERLGDVPGSAQLLEEDDLELQGLIFEDVHRVLRQVPGVNVQEEEGFGLRVNVGLRGTGSERSSKITVMEDGVLAAPAPYAAPAAYYFPVAGRMEAIEVRKGSSQIKYGPHTTGGALNLISSSIPTDFHARGTLQGGEFRTGKLHARAGDSYRNFGWLLETYQVESEGFKDLDGGDATGFDIADYLLKLRLNTDPDVATYQELELKLGRTDEVSDETYLGLTEGDFRADPFRRYAASQNDEMDADHELYQLRHFIRPGGHVDLTTVIYRNDFRRNWYKLQDVNRKPLDDLMDDPEAFAPELDIIRGATSEAGALRVRANNRSYYAHGIQSVLGLRLGSERLTHELEVGARYHRDQEDRFQHDDAYQMVEGRMVLTAAGAPGSQDNRIGDAEAGALFVQDRISMGRWTLTPGLRFEDIRFKRTDYAKDDPQRNRAPTEVRESGVSVLIPGLGATYSVNRDLSFFGGLHRGFGPPGPGADDNTEPEESVNYELGARILRGALEAQLAGFFNDYENVLGASTLATGGSGSGDLFNGGAVEVGGLELSLEYDLAGGGGREVELPLRLAYTYTHGEFKSSFKSDFEAWGEVESGDELPYLPEHQLFAGAGIEGRRWGFNLSASYVDRMRTVAGRGPIAEGEGTDDYLIFGVSGEYEIAPWSTLVAGVQNLTDEAYVVSRRPAGARPGLPRTFMAGLRFEL